MCAMNSSSEERILILKKVRVLFHSNKSIIPKKYFSTYKPTDSCLCPQHTLAHLCPQQHSKAEWWTFVSQFEKKIYVSSLIPKIYCWGNIQTRENLCVCKPARSRPRLCRPDRRRPAGSCARWPGSKEGTADQQSIIISMYVQKSEIKFSESIPYSWSPNS